MLTIGRVRLLEKTSTKVLEKVSFLLIFCCQGFFPGAFAQPVEKKAKFNIRERPFVVVIDPGHGGKQKGAVGLHNTVEKNLVLDIARKAKARISEELGIKVVMTRIEDEDISLHDRVLLANNLQADLFISIHANAFLRRTMGGVETFFHSLEASEEEALRVASEENAEAGLWASKKNDPVHLILEDMQQAEKLRDASRFAHMVQERLANALPFSNLGVMQADFIVLRETRMPAVLLELGFLTNSREANLLKKNTTQERIAVAIHKAVSEYRQLILRKDKVLENEP